jgi:hypothetical protein
MKYTHIAWGIILLLSINLIPITISIESNKSNLLSQSDTGTLSGYIRDTNMNPIEGAKIIIYFHESYEENYSNSNGYYHVTNIPICFCLKNASVSKEGYISENVLIAINETTRQDFILKKFHKQIYVGGNGPNNYSTIQEGVDHAPGGYTVFVYNGLYNETLGDYGHVEIERSINLVGEDKKSTIINGSGIQRVVRIISDNVNISGFTIQNGGDPYSSNYGMGIEVNRDLKNIRINNNIIKNNMHGIEVGTGGNSSYIYIYDNQIYNSVTGIQIQAPYSRIYRNNIYQNNNGISTGNDNCFIYENIISNNSVGMDLWGDSHNIHNNHINENVIGLQTSNTRNIIIKNNNFINNNQQAKFFKYIPLILSPFILLYRTNWNTNYWDDWTNNFPKPITGINYITLTIHPKITITIAIIPTYQVDWNPSQEPYDIPILEVNIV